MVANVKRFLIWAQHNSVRLLNIASNLYQGAIGVKPIDGFSFQFSRLRTTIARVCEINTTFQVDG